MAAIAALWRTGRRGLGVTVVIKGGMDPAGAEQNFFVFWSLGYPEVNYFTFFRVRILIIVTVITLSSGVHETFMAGAYSLMRAINEVCVFEYRNTRSADIDIPMRERYGGIRSKF